MVYIQVTIEIKLHLDLNAVLKLHLQAVYCDSPGFAPPDQAVQDCLIPCLSDISFYCIRVQIPFGGCFTSLVRR
jgi:hypothetical protein